MYRCNRFEYKPPGSVILVKVYWHWITTRRVLKEWSSHIYVELNVTCERANGTSFACWASESEDILIRAVVWTRPWSSELKDWISLLMKDCVKEWTWGVKTDWMLFMISEETARRKEPKVNDWEWSELLLCKEERTNGVTEGEIHLKESELPNEQMDWRLKHNLCVFIWRTEGAIPLGSWNEVKRSDCSWMRPHTKIHSVWSNELSERNK